MKRLTLALSFSTLFALGVLVNPPAKASADSLTLQQEQGCRIVCGEGTCVWVCD